MIFPLRVLRDLVDERDLLRRDHGAEPDAREAEQLAAQRASPGSKPGRSDDEGLDDLAATGSGLPITPASATAGCSSSALSTSNGPIRWPGVLITSSPRATNQ